MKEGTLQNEERGREGSNDSLMYVPPDALPVMRVSLEVIQQFMNRRVETSGGGDATV